MGPKTKSAHLLRWHYGDRVTMGQFSNSFPKHFSYLCEYAIRCSLSCSICEYPFIFHCLHCSPSCFDPDSLLLAYLWLGLSWIDCISANKSFSSSKTSSRKPYTSSKQQERQKHSVEITINFSGSKRQTVSAYWQQPRAIDPVRRVQSYISRRANEDGLRRLKLHGQNHTKCTQFGPCKKIVFHRLCFLKTEY